MSIYYNEYIPISCAICGVEISVSTDEWNRYAAAGRDLAWVCWKCIHNFKHAKCGCGAAKITYTVFHFSWCDRYRLDDSKALIARIKELTPP